METTLNIHADILKKITLAAETCQMSRSEMILTLIKKIMDDVSQPARFGAPIKYQERNHEDESTTFHLVVREDDYEYLLDLRKLLKMSVSLILACAVKKYLGQPTQTLFTDNNRYKNYVIVKEVVDSIICWRFFWGYPPSIGNFIN
ncbi:MAG: hypothetical protein JW807_05210 [Spirochaetes bacterium]|nr:hypothetical protein [Spirochaetota bacterium]